MSGSSRAAGGVARVRATGSRGELPLPIVREAVEFDGAPLRNAMTVDVEDYFQVQAFAGVVERSSWDSRPCRVERNTMQVLEAFARADVKGTFFTLGWVAERHPQLIRAIVDAGHELASHGYQHTRVTEQTPGEFYADVTRAKGLLEDAGGVEVIGYRAATFSINLDTLWAFDELQRAGYRYGSSLNPIAHDLYGVPDAPRFAFRHRPGGLLEIPLTTVRIGEKNFPAAGGGFFRLLPYGLFRWALGRVNRVDAQPGVFYFHPWEIDPGQPRIPGAGLRSRIRHYTNLRTMAGKLDRLLREFAWGRMDDVYGVRRAPPAETQGRAA